MSEVIPDYGLSDMLHHESECPNSKCGRKIAEPIKKNELTMRALQGADIRAKVLQGFGMSG